LIVHLVRHGQAGNTHRPAGEPYPANPPLTSEGVDQAQRVARRLRAMAIDRLFTSPMLRTVETAVAIGREIDRPVEVWTGCYEHRAQPGYVCWGAREILARYPDLRMAEDFTEDDWPYGEEPLERALERAEAFIAWLREHAASGDIAHMAVVTHGAFTRLVLGKLLGVEPPGLQPITLENTSICTLDLAPDAFKLLAIGDTCHLI
jgi:probable phosphoglycerate mutase